VLVEEGGSFLVTHVESHPEAGVREIDIEHGVFRQGFGIAATG
jgi:hypothetical protein